MTYRIFKCFKFIFKFILQTRKMAQQVLLGNAEGLVGKDLRQAYSAVGAPNDVTAGMAVR